MRDEIEPRRNATSMTPWMRSPLFGRSFRDFDDVFGDIWSAISPLSALSSLSRMSGASQGSAPLCDVRETDKEYMMSFDVPGMDKSDLDVEVSGDRLVVSGERREEEQSGEKGGRSYFSELRYGSFERSFTLPPDADTSNLTAQYENGVLQISIPKSVDAGRKSRVEIQSGSSGRKAMAAAEKHSEKSAEKHGEKGAEKHGEKVAEKQPKS